MRALLPVSPLVHLCRPRLRCLLLLALLLPAVVGCSVFKRGAGEEGTPPDYARAEATAQADLSRFASDDPWGAVFSEGLSAASDPLRLDAALEDPAARTLVARAAARREALRRLAEAVLASQDPSGSPASEAIAGNAEAQARLTRLLEEQAIIVYADTAQGITASARLAAGPLRTFFAPGGAGGAPILTDTQRDEANQAAYEQAMAKAKQQLKAELLALKAKGDRTVGDALGKDASAMNDLNARLFITQPDEVAYPVPGTCKVVIFFDKNRALELARRSMPWWKFWG